MIGWMTRKMDSFGGHFADCKSLIIVKELVKTPTVLLVCKSVSRHKPLLHLSHALADTDGGWRHINQDFI